MISSVVSKPFSFLALSEAHILVEEAEICLRGEVGPLSSKENPGQAEALIPIDWRLGEGGGQPL